MRRLPTPEELARALSIVRAWPSAVAAKPTPDELHALVLISSLARSRKQFHRLMAQAEQLLEAPLRRTT